MLTGSTDKFNGVKSTSDSIDLLIVPYTESHKSRFTFILLALQKNALFATNQQQNVATWN